MKKKINSVLSWDTEDAAIAYNTHDPHEARTAWYHYLRVDCGLDPLTPDYEIFEEVVWEKAEKYWTHPKSDDVIFDKLTLPEEGAVPYMFVMF